MLFPWQQMRCISAFWSSKDFTQTSADFLLPELNLGNLKKLLYLYEIFVWAMDKFQPLVECQDPPCCISWYESMSEGRDDTLLMHFNFLKLMDLI